MKISLGGKAVASSLCERLHDDVKLLREHGIMPTLAIVRVGEREADLAYERGATKRCESVGISVKKFTFESSAEQSEIIDLIKKINVDDSIHGCLILLPLPKQINEEAVRETLAPEKDVDGITEGSQCGVYANKGVGFPPCTAAACMSILDFYKVPIEGKRCVVVGRSLVVGRPVAMMLLARNGTVTICHTKTRKLTKIAHKADILVAAAGRIGVVTDECLSKRQTLIDVGIHFENGKLRGDVSPDDLEIPYAATPVPHGVGAVTSSILAAHVVEAAKKAFNVK